MGRRLRATVCLVGLGMALSAAAADDLRAERARIRADIAAAEAAFAARERECRTRFVVTACVDEARRERNARVQALRREDSVIDETVRRERAAQRRAEIRAKVEAAAGRERQAEAAADAAGAAASAPARTRVVTRRNPVAVRPPEPGASEARRAEREAEAERRVRQRQAQQAGLEKEREQAAQRAAERARQKKPPAAPLPVPGAASAVR